MALKAACEDPDTYQDVVLEALENPKFRGFAPLGKVVEVALDNPGTRDRIAGEVVGSGVILHDSPTYEEAKRIFFEIPGNFEEILSDRNHPLFRDAVLKLMQNKEDVDVQHLAAGRLEAARNKTDPFFANAVFAGMQSDDGEVKQVTATLARDSGLTRRLYFKKMADEILGEEAPKKTES